jgi:phosphoadenosine phosphosulfate reductase
VQDHNNLTAEELLAWLIQEPGKKVFTTSLGAEDQVLLAMLSHVLSRMGTTALAHNLVIITLDTGRLPPETYQVLAENRQAFPELPIQIYFPDTQAVEDLVNNYGINLFFESVELRKACCYVRKVAPLNRALAGASYWLSGLRREQASTRGELKALEQDLERSLTKVSPLWNWSQPEVFAYLDTHKVPRNSLHAIGYPSIGCAPCTRPIQAGENERAGRWWWETEDHKECGLHLNQKSHKPSKLHFEQLTNRGD